MTRKHKPHWYKFYVTECPVCGCGDTYRTRVYGKKPQDLEKRYKWDFSYDNCLW